MVRGRAALRDLLLLLLRVLLGGEVREVVLEGRQETEAHPPDAGHFLGLDGADDAAGGVP